MSRQCEYPIGLEHSACDTPATVKHMGHWFCDEHYDTVRVDIAPEDVDGLTKLGAK